MYTVVLQDWLSLSITGSGSALTFVTQRAADYVDATAIGDAIFFIEVASASSTPTLQLQTSPTRDDALFANMTTLALSSGVVGLVTTKTVVLAQGPSVPVAKWIRWRMQADAGTTPIVTFRVTAALGTGR